MKSKQKKQQQAIAAEPATSYSVGTNQTSNIPGTGKERIMRDTMSVDYYFDELISLVHKDYANL